MDEDVVTETSFPAWRGWKADKRGSALYRIDCNWKLFQQLVMSWIYGAIYLGFFGYKT